MEKLSRRDALKAFAAAGAFLFAKPYLPGTSSLNQAPSNPPETYPIEKDPLVVVLKDGKLLGFRGLQEFVVSDDELVARLSSRFGSKSVE